MYKAFLLIPCLLACMVAVVGQERAPQSPPFSPNVQRIFDRINAMTPEERVLLRESTRAWLDKRHASEQRTFRMPSQNPLTPFSAMSPLGGLLEVTQDPNLLQYGPFGPNVKYGPLGPIGEGQTAPQNTNAGPNPGLIWNLDGFTGPLDGVKLNLEGLDLKLEGFNERVEASTNGAIEALNKLQQLSTVPSLPPVLGPADRTLLPSTPSASADSYGPVRAQASRLKVPKFIRNRFKHTPTCAEKAEILFKQCINGEIGPKGGHSSDGCVNGREAYKAQCP